MHGDTRKMMDPEDPRHHGMPCARAGFDPSRAPGHCRPNPPVQDGGPPSMCQGLLTCSIPHEIMAQKEKECNAISGMAVCGLPAGGMANPDQYVGAKCMKAGYYACYGLSVCFEYVSKTSQYSLWLWGVGVVVSEGDRSGTSVEREQNSVVLE